MTEKGYIMLKCTKRQYSKCGFNHNAQFYLIVIACISLFSSCNVGYNISPSVTYLRSDTTKTEEIVGFYNDSEIIVHQKQRISDWYESEEDNYSKTRPAISVLRSFNYRNFTYSKPIAVPDYPYTEIYGKYAYYTDGINTYSLNFSSSTSTKINRNPFGGALGISGNGLITYNCDYDAMYIVINGKSTKIDSIPVERGVCDGYEIVSIENSWYMINNNYNPIRYAKIGSNGIVSHLINSNDSVTGYVYVHNIGVIPYDLIGDSLNVPEFLDSNGVFKKAFIDAKKANTLNAEKISKNLDAVLRNNSIYDLVTGDLLYSASAHIDF
jgi:hypothetical protein